MVLSNASDRLACQIITDRGVTMIPLPRWDRTEDRRMHKNKEHDLSRHLSAHLQEEH